MSGFRITQREFSHRPGRRRFLLTAGRWAAGALAGPLLPPAARMAMAQSPDVERLADRFSGAVAALEKKFPYAYALLTADESMAIQADRTGVSVTTTGPRQGLVLGVFDGLGLREEATSFVTPEGIDRAVENLLASAGQALAGESPDPGTPLMESWTRGIPAARPEDLPARVDQVREIQSRLMALSPDVLNASLTVTLGSTDRLFVNRSRKLRQILHETGLSASMIRGGKAGPGVFWLRKSGIGARDHTALAEAEIHDLHEKSGRLTLATAIPPGERVVGGDPPGFGGGGDESFGHGVETDMFVKGRARAAAYLGKPVGSPLVHIVDDPTQPDSNGFYVFDDEGFLAAPTPIVEAGVFRSGITDLMSARQLRMQRTANGRREAFDHKAYARMSNTFFSPGGTPVDQLIGDVKEGVLVGRFRSGIEDPKGWGIQIVSQYGEEIRNGKLTGRVYSPVTLSGYVPDVLQSVDAVGKDFALGPGNCGKGSKEWVPVGMGGPHLRFRARVS